MDKKDWTYRKLGEVCDFERGLTYSKNDESPIPTENSVFRSNNVDLDTKQIVLDDIKYLVSDFCIPDSKKVRPNTILICMSNGSMQHVGKVAHIEKNYNSAFGGFMGLLIPKQECLSKYLFYFLNSSNYRHFLISIANGVNITNLKFSDLRNLNLPIPLLPTQQRIVAELDCISTILEKKRQQLKELDNLAQAIFYEMFGDPVENEKGWEVKKLGEIGTIKIGPFGSLLHTSDYITNGIPLVNPVHMQNGCIKADNNFTISTEKARELNAYQLKTNDLIFARRGDIGRCAVVSEKENGFLCGTGSLFVRFERILDVTFILFCTKAESFIKDLVSKAKGATMLNINCKIVEDLLVILPPLSLQQSFAAKIEAIEKQKERISQSIKEVQTLFDSRMEEYFG